MSDSTGPNDHIATDFDVCPNCKNKIKDGSAFCPDCGYGRKQIHFVDDPIEGDLRSRRPVPFRWWVVLIMLFLVPIAAFGACFLSGPSIDHPDWRINAALIVELASIGIALIMILVNGIFALFRAN